MLDLFADTPPWPEPVGDGVVVLRRQAREYAPRLLHAVERVTRRSPFRHFTTPGGYRMSVAMTNCGRFGWVSDSRGYRYETCDPLSRLPWPSMPAWMNHMAEKMAEEAGFTGFSPDACLINRYQTGARMALHQDKDERELAAPIVSISLGVAAVFQFGGPGRTSPVQRLLLEHGDVVVWGGAARLNFHEILTLKAGQHPLTGSDRINLTFRRVAENEP